MTVSLRLNNEDSEVLKAYAALNHLSVSELIRKAVFERIEDEYDIKAYDEALAEYKKNPVTYSFEDIEKELGL